MLPLLFFVSGRRMHKPVLLIAASLLGLSLSGCANLMGTTEPAAGTDKSTTPSSVSAQPLAGEPLDTAPDYADFEPEVLYLLLSAEVAGQRGRYDVTLVNYIRAAELSRDPGIIRRAMGIAQSLSGDNAQQQLGQLWLETEPDSLEAHRILTIQAIKRNQMDAALQHMEAIMSLGGDGDFDNLAAMSSTLPPESQQELLVLYQQLHQRHPDNLEIEYSIALLQKINGQPQSALERLDTVLENAPTFQPAVMLKGDLLYETGETGQALDYLQRNTRIFPGNRQMGTLYARMLINEGNMRAAQDEFARLMQQFPDVPGLRLSHALVALENNETDLATDDLNDLIAQGHHVDEANFYLGKIADDQQRTQEAIGYYERVAKGSHYFPALSRASALRAEAGDIDGALTNIRTLREANPNQAENYWLIEINLLMEAGRTEAAIDMANSALQDQPGSVRIRYARAMLYDAIDRTSEAEADLQQVLAEEPDNAVALNALGYILATKTDRLDEAETMIRRALELSPGNPAIQDSMGWVLFRQGNHNQALEYLKAAYSDFRDPEVAAHYGEVLWTMGEQEQARIIWREALATDMEHPILRETILRLTGDQDL